MKISVGNAKGKIYSVEVDSENIEVIKHAEKYLQGRIISELKNEQIPIRR